MLRYITLALMGCSLVLQPAAAQVASAQLQGAILGELGKPLAGARVLYTRKARLVPGQDGKWRNAAGPQPFSSQVVTDAAGRYRIPQLPPGDYDLCMDAPGYLATCEWAGWRRATLSQGQAADNGPVQLTKAVPLTIQINDSLSLLNAANRLDSPLVVGVRDRSGRLHPGREISVIGNSHAFQVDVPPGTPLNVWLHSWRFVLTDSTGAALHRLGAQFPFQAEASATPPTVVFNIAGELNR